MRRLAAALLASVLVAGCGSGDRGETLTVSAASSLETPFERYADEYDGARVRLSFGGSDALAAQIRRGVRPDVFAAANTKLPDALYEEGLVEKPVVFAGNRLVIAVPSDSRVRSVEDLARPGLKLVIGSESVPVGEYTRQVLSRLPDDTEAAILGNVRSDEPEVAGVVGKLIQGAADAGFAYLSDVVAADGRLRAIELPRSLQPSVVYGAAVVKGARNPDAARAWIDGLVQPDGHGARLLREAGFEKPK